MDHMFSLPVDQDAKGILLVQRAFKYTVDNS